MFQNVKHKWSNIVITIDAFLQGHNLINLSIYPILFLESAVVQICEYEQLLLVSNYTKCILCNTETEEFKQVQYFYLYISLK